MQMYLSRECKKTVDSVHFNITIRSTFTKSVLYSIQYIMYTSLYPGNLDSSATTPRGRLESKFVARFARVNIYTYTYIYVRCLHKGNFLRYKCYISVYKSQSLVFLQCFFI